MKILLAGPGTGKTTRIKEIIKSEGDGSRFLIISFTNATVNDLQQSLKEQNISEKNCMTLHKFAVKYNHDKQRVILSPTEELILKKISEKLEIDFDTYCDSLTCTTFQQMIKRFVEFSNTNKTYLSNNLSDFDTLIVDEYQDFNPLEQQLIDLLVEYFKEVYILGDDDQCIYDFKDASSEKIISFYNDDQIEKLPHENICYRCPDLVVNYGANLISNNKNRVEKEWKTNNIEGSVRYIQANTLEEMSENIVKNISEIPSNESIIILSPVKFLIEPLISKLNEGGIEHENLFNPLLPAELEIKAWEVKSLYGNFRELNLIFLSYGLLTNRKKFYELLKYMFDKGFDFDKLYEYVSKKLPPEMTNSNQDINDYLSSDRYIEIKNLYEDSEGDNENEKLLNLFRQNDEIVSKTVRIMSIHKSKGLGADNVFIIGLVQGILPNAQRGNDSLESQRRLLYVGITRTKKRLFLYSSIKLEGKFVNKVDKSSFKFSYRDKLYDGMASSFINELKLEK